MDQTLTAALKRFADSCREVSAPDSQPASLSRLLANAKRLQATARAERLRVGNDTPLGRACRHFEAAAKMIKTPDAAWTLEQLADAVSAELEAGDAALAEA